MLFRRFAGSVPDGADDNLVSRRLVEDQVWEWRHSHASDGRIIGRRPHHRMPQEQVYDRLNAGLHPVRSLWRASRDIGQDSIEIGKRGRSVAEPHSPYLDQTARTCSSVANSPRAVSAFDRAIA